jgi:ABC-type Fe3+/spermidine/putrescine transport system ATPase subunit
MSAIDVRGLRKEFGGRAVLDGVSFRAASGDIMSVIGPSGSGKTTLFRCILGEVPPDDGTILLDGEDATSVPIERRGVGVVYQNYALFPHMTVAQNVGYGLRARGASTADTAARVKEMLELVQLTGKEDRTPRRLSGGEKQRVALARALAVKPRILLLDEAFAALDATTRSEVVYEVRGIVRRAGVTTMLVTHDQEEAFLFARKVLVLNAGRVVTTGPSEEVMAHPDPFLQGFVKMVHFSRSKVEEDASGRRFVTLPAGRRVAIELPNVQPGEEVHIMVKKGPQAESIEVWPDDGR